VIEESAGDGCLEGPGGWRLTPEGAAVHPGERTAVVADVHLGYEWARAGGGDCVPEHTLRETLAKLDALLRRVPGLKRFVVAGDLVESRRSCLRTARDVAALARWLDDRGVEFLPIAGNHDPPRRPPRPSATDVAGWTVAHGHRPVAGAKTVTGHLHPLLRAPGVNAPCYLVGPSAIVLPAFSGNAAGVELALLGPSVTAVDRPGGAFRCVAAAGGTLLDFGPVSDLIRALSGASVRAAERGPDPLSDGAGVA